MRASSRVLFRNIGSKLLKTQQDRLDPARSRSAARATQHSRRYRYLEQAVTEIPGMTDVVLRYKAFYGPDMTRHGLTYRLTSF